MSVVNKMLQDLEARKADDAEAGADYQPAPARKSNPWFIGGAILVGLAAIAWWLFDQQNIQRPQTQPVATAPQPLSSEPETAMPETTQPPIVASNDIAPAELPEQNEPVVSMPDFEPVVDDNAQFRAQLPNTVPQEQNLTAEQVDIAAETAAQDTVQHTLAHQQEAEPPSHFSVTTAQNTNDLESLKQQAKFALQRGQEQRAASLLTKVVEKQPENDTARRKLAALMFASQQQQSAEQLLTDGLRINPLATETRLMLGKMYLQQKRPSDAMNVLFEHPSDMPVSNDYLAYRATLAEQQGSASRANQDYLSLLKGQPTNARWWLGLAVTYERMQKLNEAYHAYQKVIELNQLSEQVMGFVQQRLDYLASKR